MIVPEVSMIMQPRASVPCPALPIADLEHSAALARRLHRSIRLNDQPPPPPLPFSPLYTHFLWVYNETIHTILRLEAQVSTTRLQTAEHNSFVFTFLQNSNHKSHHLAHLDRRENTGLPNTTSNHQLVSLTSHLFKLNWKKTFNHVWEHQEASGKLCVEMSSSDQDGRWDTDSFTSTSVSPHLYS